MDQIKQHLGPQGPKFYQNSGFWWFWGVRGGLGPSPIDAGWKNKLGVLFSWFLVGSMRVSCRFLIFDESLGYAYSSGFKPFSIKSTFEPITPPLKWVLTDAAYKVSMIFFNIAPVWAGNCKMDCQNTEFYSRVLLFENFEKSLPGRPPGSTGPPQGGKKKKTN